MNKQHFAKAIAILVLVCLASGCTMYSRWTIAARVKDYGSTVKTRYKYYFTGIEKADYHIWLSGGTSINQSLPWGHENLVKMQPEAFASGGIPIFVSEDITGSMNNRIPDSMLFVLRNLLTIFSCGIIPQSDNQEYNMNRKIHLFDNTEPIDALFMVRRWDSAIGIFFSPLPLLFYNFDTKIKNLEDCPTFTFREARWGSPNRIIMFQKWNDFQARSMAYAIAAKLKELEDEGLIDEETVLLAEKAWARRNSNIGGTYQNVQKRVGVSNSEKMPYRIVRCERDKESGFAFAFELEILDGNTSKEACLRNLKSFASTLREMYADTFPDVIEGTLQVDFPVVSMEKNNLIGRAVVLSLKASLSYDQITRKGVIAIQVTAGQMAEVRRWALRNIAILARDKNIAIVTGVRPPDGQYRILNERQSGSILEIEFKTE